MAIMDARPGEITIKEPEVQESVIIRFAGDSGDGIQLTGSLFTHDSAALGHDISTLTDFPAEIRAPVGTRAGVSSFQLNFSSGEIHTPGDRLDVLVALNPAALAVNLNDLPPGGIIILNEDAFNKTGLKKAKYGASDPRDDGTLAGYQVYPIPITSLTLAAVEPLGLGKKHASRCKNMFTVGLIAWIYDRPIDGLLRQVDMLFDKKKRRTTTPEKYEIFTEANRLALRAGYNYADTIEMFISKCRVGKANLPAGTYRRVTGNEATALGFLAASTISGLELLYASYPITPASEILHELSKFRHLGVRTVQAEDEIAAVGMAIGAAYGGKLGLTGTSGPGVALKSEAIGLAVMAELPLVIVNVQRGGPSTGLPTKTEQADLLQAMYGRNGECPVVVIAPQSPADCFGMALEAYRLAIKYMTPVFLLSDGYIANGSEPWRIPDNSELPDISVSFPDDPEEFQPYARNPDTLARPWAIPGTPGLEHCIGGIEKEDIAGKVSYDSANHERMIHLRDEKIQKIANDVPNIELFGPKSGDLLVLGWGGTYGAIRHAVQNAQKHGLSVASAHIRYLNPLPTNLGDILRDFKQVLMPELNSGQLRMLIRAEYLVDAVGLEKISGQPLQTNEVENRIYKMLGFSPAGKPEPTITANNLTSIQEA
ncbi:MAG TPA: 2-oxoacid:acceptor oxidoreductase subunit alpha [Gammaproteobacteria bacterium]|jgi:2-oxoglutarate ferredoxin oxidoreductase subunit alpha|nr:2-oxoacid:acceptor oxidoreductase subunit alpha [Gammaproteobacteria bacterium]HJP39774.1 2-oxoacid:acceptor oxidoreductase subunit alpha [Gammaproteobacteria bacterium]